MGCGERSGRTVDKGFVDDKETRSRISHLHKEREYGKGGRKEFERVDQSDCAPEECKALASRVSNGCRQEEEYFRQRGVRG